MPRDGAVRLPRCKLLNSNGVRQAGRPGRGVRLSARCDTMASQTMQNAGQSQRSAAYELWSDALLEVLLPQLPEDRRGAPVLLACE